MSLDPGYPPVSPITAGITGRCPRCGQGKMFRGFLALAPQCSVCGFDLGAFADTGHGPAVFVSLIAGTIVVALALWVEVVYEPSIWVYVVVFLPLTFVLCLGILRLLMGVLIALQYRNKAEQGHFDP